YATNQEVAGLANGTAGLVQQDPTTRAITVGAGTDGTSVGFANNVGAARTLTGVATGTVAAGSTQAVNGGQLYGTAASVAGALGGGAGVNPDGTVSAPAYSVGGTAYNNVGGAITALDSTGVKYDTAPGGGRGQSITLAGGDPNQPVVIHNVAAGTAPTDAANVGQVQAAETQANQYTNRKLAGVESQMSGMNSRLNGLQSDVNEAKQEASTAGAIGLAAASLRYDDRPGKFSVAAGGGFWRGYSAGAFGVGYTLPDGHFRLNATAATDGRDVGAGAGLSYTFN
ncbi:MAG: YadA-like family protein, partial [Caulobacteraceae bacterium]|nr:YadA-like family protein [Caulobacter sp.]